MNVAVAKRPCRAKNPETCPYHGPYMRMEKASKIGDFEAYAQEKASLQILRQASIAPFWTSKGFDFGQGYSGTKQREAATTEELTYFSEFDSPEVRRAVAKYDKTPPEVLAFLADDEDDTIVEAAISNPNFSELILSKSASNNLTRTQIATLAKVATDQETMKRLLSSPFDQKEHPSWIINENASYLISQNKYAATEVLHTIADNTIHSYSRDQAINHPNFNKLF